MSNVVEFLTADRPITESEVDKLHSEAFRDLEPGICDCTTMAKIAAQFVIEADDGTNRELVFAVAHLSGHPQRSIPGRLASCRAARFLCHAYKRTRGPSSHSYAAIYISR